jgi:hypothetical protein
MFTKQKIYRAIAKSCGCSTSYVRYVDRGYRSDTEMNRRVVTALSTAREAEQDLIRKIKAA